MLPAFPPSKADKIAAFDPNNAAADNGQLFGLPFNFEESAVVLLPVPWEVTVSYNPGTAQGPKAILDASAQVDLYDPLLKDAWQYGYYMLDISPEWVQRNHRLRPRAMEILRYLEKGKTVVHDSQLGWTLEEINKACENLQHWVFEQTHTLLKHGKLVGVIGGEHSVPLGFIRALSTIHESFGILQIDAHADLRDAYEGFTYSHASIMHNALQLDAIEQLTIVGLRDYCQEEAERIQSQSDRITAFTDIKLQERQFTGDSWDAICRSIVSSLPEKVYISFDIDGLDPKLCPNTGTPVPGGMDWPKMQYLLKVLAESGKQIIGFDLVEVAPGNDEWDGNVGARLLYQLCNRMVQTHL